MGWANFVRPNQERRTILGAFRPFYRTMLLSPQGSSSTQTVDVLNRLPFVFIGFEHLNLEGMIGAFVEVNKRSTRDQLCGYACLFLNGGELR